MRYLRLVPGRLGILIMEGQLSRAHGVCLKAITMKAVMGEAHVIMDFKGVDNMGPECLRPICEAHRASVIMKHELSVFGLSNTVLARALAESEFTRASNCVRQESLRCCLFGMQGDGYMANVFAEESSLLFALKRFPELKHSLLVRSGGIHAPGQEGGNNA